MRCLTSPNMKAFAGSCQHLPVVTQPFGVLCLAWAYFELMDFTSCFSHLPSISFPSENWDTGCPQMCWDWHLFTVVCEVKPKLPCEWESAPKACRRFPNPPSSYSWAPTSLSMFLPLLLAAPPRTQARSRAQVKTAQTLPKHNFLLPARVFLKERGEEEQPTPDLSQACLMQKQKMLH